MGQFEGDVPQLVVGPQLLFQFGQVGEEGHLLVKGFLPVVYVFELSLIALNCEVAPVREHVGLIEPLQRGVGFDDFNFIGHLLHPPHYRLPLLVYLLDHLLLQKDELSEFVRDGVNELGVDQGHLNVLLVGQHAVAYEVVLQQHEELEAQLVVLERPVQKYLAVLVQVIPHSHQLVLVFRGLLEILVSSVELLRHALNLLLDLPFDYPPQPAPLFVYRLAEAQLERLRVYEEQPTPVYQTVGHLPQLGAQLVKGLVVAILAPFCEGLACPLHFVEVSQLGIVDD